MITFTGIPGLIVGTIIFLGILFYPIAIFVILKIRSKEDKQMRENMATGVYNRWDKAITKRMQIMIISQMVLLLSFFIWIGTGFLDTTKMFSPLRLVILALIIVTIFMVGFTINRMMVKGK